MKRFQKEWYWLICMALFFLEREAIMDICFMIMKVIITITK